eukprot:GILK01010992.1.p1 GENE.GILK01010992.1~~GILK01010992.1.p1  ORF type:complete len:757 (+),score=192.56 GILK01010992.1:335-2272(+)
MADLLDIKETLQSRLDSAEKLERGVIDLYLEVKDRTVDNGSAMDKEQEFVKGQDGIVILDHLRASIRLLFSYKEQKEQDRIAKLDSRQAEREEMLKQAQHECMTLKAQLDAEKRRLETVLAQKQDAETAKKAILQNSKEIIEEIRLDNQSLLSLLKSKEDSIQAFKVEANDASRKLKDQEMLLLRIPLLEQQLHSADVKHNAELHKIQVHHQKVMADAHKELQKFNQLETQNHELQQKTTALQEEISSYRRNTDRLKLLETEEQCSKVQSMHERKARTLRKLQEDYRRVKFQLEAKVKAYEDLKKLYDRLFMAAQEEKQKKLAEEKERLRDEAIGDKNIYYVDFYKKKLTEKDKELEHLKARLNKLLQEEKRSTMRDKTFQAERSKYKSEIAQLKLTNTAIASTTSLYSGMQRSASAMTLGSHQWEFNPNSASKSRLDLGESGSESDGSVDEDSQEDDLDNENGYIFKLNKTVGSSQKSISDLEMRTQMRNLENLKALSSAATPKATSTTATTPSSSFKPPTTPVNGLRRPSSAVALTRSASLYTISNGQSNGLRPSTASATRSVSQSPVSVQSNGLDSSATGSNGDGTVGLKMFKSPSQKMAEQRLALNASRLNSGVNRFKASHNHGSASTIQVQSLLHNRANA